MALSKTLPAHKYGKAVASDFHARRADVWVARNVLELPLWGSLPDQTEMFHVPVVEGYVLVFESNHAIDRHANSGKVPNWGQVTSISEQPSSWKSVDVIEPLFRSDPILKHR
jgi:hypothetical protein